MIDTLTYQTPNQQTKQRIGNAITMHNPHHFTQPYKPNGPPAGRQICAAEAHQRELTPRPQTATTSRRKPQPRPDAAVQRKSAALELEPGRSSSHPPAARRRRESPRSAARSSRPVELTGTVSEGKSAPVSPPRDTNVPGQAGASRLGLAWHSAAMQPCNLPMRIPRIEPGEVFLPTTATIPALSKHPRFRSQASRQPLSERRRELVALQPWRRPKVAASSSSGRLQRSATSAPAAAQRSAVGVRLYPQQLYVRP